MQKACEFAVRFQQEISTTAAYRNTFHFKSQTQILARRLLPYDTLCNGRQGYNNVRHKEAYGLLIDVTSQITKGHHRTKDATQILANMWPGDYLPCFLESAKYCIYCRFLVQQDAFWCPLGCRRDRRGQTCKREAARRFGNDIQTYAFGSAHASATRSLAPIGHGLKHMKRWRRVYAVDAVHYAVLEVSSICMLDSAVLGKRSVCGQCAPHNPGKICLEP